MSTATAAASLPRPAAPDRQAIRPLGFGTQFAMELRKTLDTRAAVVLLAIALVTGPLIGFAFASWADPDMVNFATVLSFSSLGLAALLPIVGVMSMTSEWTQRSILTTFSMNPRRSQVYLAKVAASVVITVAATALTMVMAWLVCAAEGGTALDIGRTELLRTLAGFTAATIGYVLMGAGLGALIRSTALSIAVLLVAPTVVNNLHGWQRIAKVLDYLDITAILARISEGHWDGARTVVALGVWIALPLLLGWWRNQYGDAQ